MTQRLTLAAEITHDILAYLKVSGTRNLQLNIENQLTELIGAHLKDNTDTWISFCRWWGEAVHQYHRVTLTGTAHPRLMTFAECREPVCLSLLGTLADLTRPAGVSVPPVTTLM